MIKQVLKLRMANHVNWRFENILSFIKTIVSGNDLDKVGRKYGTDKVGSHFYLPHYQSHFKKFRFKKFNLLEIGVGGYADPSAGGESLRMWKRYFPFAKIFSIDIYDKSSLQESRIRIFKGSQVDEKLLNDISTRIDGWDIIIDDGSHLNYQVIESFKILFPKLNDGGIYVIEDTQTSYWENFGGDSENLNNPKTAANFFKGLTDSLNHKEFIIRNYKPSYYDQKIVSIHFYHNLIFIYKGNNDEESNIVVNNQK